MFLVSLEPAWSDVSVLPLLQCAPGGCLMELCIQLSIIMLGKQLIQNNIFEIGVPYVMTNSLSLLGEVPDFQLSFHSLSPLRIT